MPTFSSHGKLLLTGEYLVLRRAIALALPTRLGQTLQVQALETDNDTLAWNANQPSGPWFSATLQRHDFSVIQTNDAEKVQRLVDVLEAVRQLNPSLFSQNDLQFTTQLDFNPQWGLGSSSTLIANLAQWASINPYTLLKMTFGGSGYDVACASAKGPILYQRCDDIPVATPVEFNPPFSNQLFFVYQGHKQNSANEVSSFQQKIQGVDLKDDVETISDISKALPTLTSLNDFCYFLRIHEEMMSYLLDRDPIGSQFPDFAGTLKSLGAWGGDFFLAATPWPYEQTKSYFLDKGYDTLLPYSELIL